MSKIEKIVTIVVSVIGAIGGLAGLWGAYTAHDAAKFKEPFVIHDELAKSFLAQIASAEKRNDIEEVNIVRVKYEKFEESWRNTQRLAALVLPIENLANYQLTGDELQEVEKLVASVKSEQPASEFTSRTIGSAYFALGKYADALNQYQTAAKISPKDPDIFTLQAASYAHLSDEENNELDKKKNEKLAVNSIRKAMSLYKNDEKLLEYLSTNESLRQVVNLDKELTKQLTRTQ